MFGGSAISEQLFEVVSALVPDGGKILEFGSGEGTRELLKRWEVTSVEHNPKYYVNREHTIPVTLDRETGWYHEDRVKIALNQGPFDLVIIDGPPGKARGSIRIKLFEDISCPVIFDDVNRWIDRDAMRRFCKALGYEFEIIKGKEKDFAICRKDENQ